jgi:hypothetical protein
MRPHLEAPREDVPGVVVARRGRGRSDGRFKIVITALKMMPTYQCAADRNAAKRLRKARRLKSVRA